MNQYYTERRLSWFYGLIALLLGVSVICIAIPYNHWRATLDVCPGGYFENTNCGCIFYGLSTFQYFNGGHNSYCMYAIFGPLPIIVYAIVMALFHMYRVCINNIGQYEDDKTTQIEEIEGEAIVISTRARISQQNDAVIYCWIPTTCFAVLFCIYNVAHASIITDGFLKTCNQYRGYLVRELRASGDHASAIHFRLACQAILDFMDYIQKDAPNSRRGDFINTGVSLQLALITSWVSVAMWIVVAFYTARRAYKERDVLTCCGSYKLADSCNVSLGTSQLEIQTSITLENIRDVIKEEIMAIVKVQITDELKAIKQQMSDYHDSVPFIKIQYGDLESKIVEKSGIISKLLSDNETLLSIVNDLSSRLNLSEQLMRKNNLEMPEHRSENLENTDIQLTKIVHNPLGEEDVLNATRVDANGVKFLQ